jgi:hypothetical protein
MVNRTHLKEFWDYYVLKIQYEIESKIEHISKRFIRSGELIN